MAKSENYSFLETLAEGIPLDPFPENKGRNSEFPHAPKRKVPLNDQEMDLALSNSLRYFPKRFHEILRPEFKTELESYGHIYMYRFTPTFPVRAYPIQYYPGKITEAKAIMLMMMNNMDPAVAQFPQELVVYGGNGQVLSNWAQFWTVMKFLSELEHNQTLVMYSGHPLGLFPSNPQNPRMVVTNGMVIPNYSKPDDYDRYFSLGISMYGQMTAGSYAFIGPQGIVHGTTIVLFNAARKYLGTSSLKGKVYVTSGLGGMSGAQAKAAVITGVVGVIAEVNSAVVQKRYKQGWVKEIISDLDELVIRIKEARHNGEGTSIAYLGNVVDLWERLVLEYENHGDLLADLGSDQTSLHIPFSGGYCPVSLSYDQADKLMRENGNAFKEMVQKSLHRHVKAVGKMTDAGMRFWDYGNAFLLEAKRAGAPILSSEDPNKFLYPTYVEDIIGDVFALGFGPFRWVCCSGLEEDLLATDKATVDVLNEILQESDMEVDVRMRYEENLKWMKEACEHNLVVGSQARLLYSDCIGRIKIATRFNHLIKTGILKGPVVISRDHHDVSGTDSPFRETSNMPDGSKFTADMAVQNFIGDGMRGATWVALHNGGGIGWGEVMNGNFGLLLTGDNDDIVKSLITWDVTHGVVRRAWAGNERSKMVAQRAMKMFPNLKVTIPE